MAKRVTAKLSNSNLLQGNKLYQQRARVVLPYLVRQAKAGQTIYYSSLANEVEIPNARNLNYVLGAIGNALIEMSQGLEERIPPLQCIVISKTTKLPGNGISSFITSKKYSRLTITQKRRLVEEKLTDIFNYAYWDWVLEQLDLSPTTSTATEELDAAGRFGSAGESEQHKSFKLFISTHPEVLGITGVENTRVEVVLPSADRIDVVFEKGSLIIGVEVKSILSDKLDILRGLFQCVKYKYLIEARQAVLNEYPNSQVILAIEGSFPLELIGMKNVLGIEVIDNIGM